MKTLAEQIPIMQHAVDHGMTSLEQATYMQPDKWMQCEKDHVFDWNFYDYRVRPTYPRTPWTYETCPLGVEARSKLWSSNVRCLITWADMTGFHASMFIVYDTAVKEWVWRAANSKDDWKPCTLESLNECTP